MFDHIKFGVSDYAEGKAFFLEALEPSGIDAGSEGESSCGIELFGRKSKASLCLPQATGKPAPFRIAFPAEAHQQVDAFYRAAVEAGLRALGVTWRFSCPI